MKKFFKNKREIIFFATSIILLLITILYVFQTVKFLVVRVSGAVSSEDLLRTQEPVTFNLEKFKEIESNRKVIK
jgi:hypothetical protein